MRRLAAGSHGGFSVLRGVGQRSLSVRRKSGPRKAPRKTKANLLEMAKQRVDDMVTIFDQQFIEDNEITSIRLVGRKSDAEVRSPAKRREENRRQPR
eukprot:scaffold71_cov247-Pinguiococcus_pyrenoidosus.AAC.39